MIGQQTAPEGSFRFIKRRLPGTGPGVKRIRRLFWSALALAPGPAFDGAKRWGVGALGDVGICPGRSAALGAGWGTRVCGREAVGRSWLFDAGFGGGFGVNLTKRVNCGVAYVPVSIGRPA